MKMIKRLRNHDEEAFDYCYFTYKNLVYFHIIKIVKNNPQNDLDNTGLRTCLITVKTLFMIYNIQIPQLLRGD